MKALCVFSGGLDSMLAASLIKAQGVEVLAFFFETPFFTSEKALKSAKAIDIPIRVVNIFERHLQVVKKPRHGYGGNMNPCIDCHALMFRIAGEMLEKEKADFVVTGEVLGQRPMSQNRKSLAEVAAESGLGGLLLRPLSARRLPITIPEENKWVEREGLMDFQGRSRKPQMELARIFNVEQYPSPAGGCLLTDMAFSKRLRDLFLYCKSPAERDIELLKLGRHFRIGPEAKLIVGRNKQENEAIRGLARTQDLLLTAVSVPGPTVLLTGDFPERYVDFAAGITAAYGDSQDVNLSEIRVTGDKGDRIIRTQLRNKEEFKGYLL